MVINIKLIPALKLQLITRNKQKTKTPSHEGVFV